jgi:hypothetical protein
LFLTICVCGFRGTGLGLGLGTCSGSLWLGIGRGWDRFGNGRFRVGGFGIGRLNVGSSGGVVCNSRWFVSSSSVRGTDGFRYLGRIRWRFDR